MEKSVPKDDAFLIEGARSYLQATTALVHYQQEVQKKCRLVMEGYISDYASALGVGLKSGDIEAIAWPETRQWDGSWACLGVKIAKRGVIRGIRWWESYCCL